MKKFEEELEQLKNNSHTNFYGYMGIRLLTEPEIIETFKDWVSPEDHATGIVKWKHENQRLRTLLDAAGESSKELLDINKKLRGDLGDAQGKLRGSEDYIKELKSQIEKQQPDVPEFVATEIEEKNRRFSNFHKTADITHYVKDVRNWYYEKPYHAELFYRAVLDGYTVKEKRFYLKHKSVLIFDPDSDDSDVDELYLGAGGNFVPYQHLAKIFTQREIDSMETGSYEQIPVEEEA